MAKAHPAEIWSLSALMEALTPLGKLSLLLSGLAMLAAASGDETMVIGISMQAMAATVIVAALLELLAIYGVKYFDAKKHSAEEIKFSATYALAVLVGTAATAYIAFVLLYYVAPGIMPELLVDPIGCYVVSVAVALVVGWVLDSILIHLIADGVAGALIVKAQQATAGAVLDDERIKQAAALMGMSEDAAKAFLELFAKK